MLRTKFYLIASLLLSFSANVNAQRYLEKEPDNYLSPFSIYGPGEIQSPHFIRHRAMGHTSIAVSDGNRYSASNPASLANVNSFVFETGIRNHIYEIKSGAQQLYKSYDFQLPYFSFALPIDTTRHIGLGVSLTPFSRSAYRFSAPNSTVAGSKDYYIGTGGLSQFSVGGGFTLFKGFSLGANAGYLFGSQKAAHNFLLPESNSNLNLGSSNRTIVGGFVFDAGALLKIKLSKASRLQLGFIANLESDVDARRELTAFVFDRDSIIRDTAFNNISEKGKMHLPLGLGGGFHYTYDNALNREKNKDNSFAIAADFYQRKWSEFKTLDISEPLQDNMQISGGIEWKPNSKKIGLSAANNFFRRTYYRAGAKYATNMYNLNGITPIEQSISLGVGLPFITNRMAGSSPSYLDFTIEAGEISAGNHVTDIRQRYITFSLGVHLSESGWFKRSKID